MGESIRCAAPTTVELHVVGTTELADVVVFRDGEVWRSTRPAAAAIASTLAPVRLEVRLPSDGGPPAADWQLTLRAATATFDLLEDRRDTSGAIRPSFTRDGDALRFTWPRGFAPGAGVSAFAARVRGTAETRLELVAPESSASATLAELCRAPVTVPTPHGSCTVSLEPNDAVVDVDRGLGTREFHAEWEEPAVPASRSWYYARVIQTDGEMAWTSPIFVRRGD